jgi:hypothetical protein
MYTASCLCGGVQILIDAELGLIDVCHCLMCRKASGGPFATNAPVAADAFHVRAGTELLKAYASSTDEERVFCSRCGSPLFARKASVPGVVRIRVGVINEPLKTRPAAHFHVASKSNWWPISDDLPRHATE